MQKYIESRKSLVYILILNYKCADETIACLDSIQTNITDSDYRIIILDNDSADGSFERLSKYVMESSTKEDLNRCEQNRIKLIQNDVNYGYANGNNVGIKIALDEGADYICIVNPDVIVEEDFLTELVNIMDKDSTIGIIGPASYDSDTPDLCSGCGVMIGKFSGYSIILNSGMRFEEINSKSYDCDYLCGMCIIIRSDVIKKIGFIPEEYFLFYEETEWCMKCHKAGYRCVANSGVKVIHKGSFTVDQASNGKVNLHNYYLYRNRIVFQKRNRPFSIYVLFLLYYIIEIIYERVKGHYTREVWKAYIDGISGRDRLHHIIKK